MKLFFFYCPLCSFYPVAFRRERREKEKKNLLVKLNGSKQFTAAINNIKIEANGILFLIYDIKPLPRD